MTRKFRHLYLLALLLPGVILLTGCLTHVILIDFGEPKRALYTMEGDSLDLFDGRLPSDPGPPWSEINRKAVPDEEGNVQWTIVYEASLTGESIPFTIAPPETSATIRWSETSYIFLKKKSFVLSIPSWKLIDFYGDLEEFVPENVKLLELPGADTLFTRDQSDELKRQKAEAHQEATGRRYILQIRRMVRHWNQTHGTEADDTLLVHEATELFTPMVRAHRMTLENQDPMETTLEWYPELRQPMIEIACEVTRAEPDWMANVADSLDHRWKTWLDIEDDGIQVQAYLPALWIDASCDSTRGDTCYWTVEPGKLADESVTVRAAAFTPVLWADILAGIILLAIIVFAVVRWPRKSS